MTPAQRDALELLAAIDGKVGAHKRRTTDADARVPRVNAVAASALSRLGYARATIIPHAGPFSSPYRYRITDAGRKALAG